MECSDLEKLFRKIRREIEVTCGFVHFFFHYTFHDLRHYRNMDEYLSHLGYRRLELSYPELFILRMAIYLHDMGMFLNPRYWSELKIHKEDLLICNEDPVEKLRKNLLVDVLMRKMKTSFEDEFFDESGFLRFPPKMMGKTWDSFDLIDKAGIREVMRVLHPQVGAGGARRFIPRCDRVASAVSSIIRLHECKTAEAFRYLGHEEVGGEDVDLRKLAAILVLLDSIDCSRRRASPEALEEITDEIRMLEEEIIEIESEKSSNHGYLSHWIFKRHIKRIEIEGSSITIVSDTSSPAHVAGMIFFEMANNVLPRFIAAKDMLSEYGVALNLFLRIPGLTAPIYLDERIMDAGRSFCSIFTGFPDWASRWKRRYGSREFTLPRVLALLLGGQRELGMRDPTDKINSFAAEHVCKLLESEKLSDSQRAALLEIFKCVD